MSDAPLDPTAQRANEPGWTPEAVRAERQARRAAFWGSIGRGIAAAWDFIVRNMLLALAIAATIASATFEWVNSARGWGDLYPGFHALIISAGAFGALMIWYTAVDQAFAEWQRPKTQRDVVKAGGWIVIAVLAYVVCVVGVFVATATNSVKYQQAAKASRTELVKLTADRDALKAELDVYNVDYWAQTEKQIERTIISRETTARNTWGLPDLKVDGGCAMPKLAFEARRMCVRVNGGDDPTTGEAVLGIRTELENVQREIRAAAAKEQTLKDLESQVRNFHVVKGDQTAQALEDLELGVSGERGTAILYWLLSSAFLLISGWTGHWAWNEVLAKRRAARLKAGKAV